MTWPLRVMIGPISFYSSGLLLFLGLFWGGFIFWRKGREEGIEEEKLMDIWLGAAIISFIVSRAWLVLSRWEEFNHWYRILFFTKFPGLAYEGALLGFWLGVLALGFRSKMKLWCLVELAIFGQVIMEIFGRLGQPITWQTSGVLVLAILYQLLVKWEKEYRNFDWYKGGQSEAEPGFLTAVYLIGLGGVNFGLSWLNRPSWFWLVLVVVGVLILMFRSGKLFRAGKKPAESNLKTMPRFKLKRKKRGFDFK